MSVHSFVGYTYAFICDNTAVFKQDETGRRGFDTFMMALGLKETI